jgi:RNAse (barnase) inhibitor barstar
MNTFFLIIKKHFNITDYPFQNLDSLQKIIFFMFICKKEYSLKIKFKYITDQINNIFLTEEQKDDFINIFCKIQKTYFALARLAYIYKYKKAKIIVDFDLCLNPIDTNNKNSICLLQEKYKYCWHKR